MDVFVPRENYYNRKKKRMMVVVMVVGVGGVCSNGRLRAMKWRLYDEQKKCSTPKRKQITLRDVGQVQKRIHGLSVPNRH